MSFNFSLVLLSILFSLSIGISIGNAPLNVNALSVRSMVKAAAPAPAVSAAAVSATTPAAVSAVPVKIESNSNSNSNNNATVAKHAGMQTKGLTFGFKENPPFFAIRGPYGPLKIRGNELVLSLTGAPGLDSFFEWVNGYQLRLVGTNSCLDSNSGTQVYLNPQCGANINDNPHQNFIVVDNGHIQWRGDIRKPLTTKRCFQVDGRTDGAKLIMNTCTTGPHYHGGLDQNFEVPAAPTFRIAVGVGVDSPRYLQVNGAMANGAALVSGSSPDTDGSLNPTFNGIFEWYNNQQLRLFGNNYCLDNNGQTENGSPVNIWTCSPTSHPHQTFVVVNKNRIQKTGTNKCLDWDNGNLILWTCNCGDESPSQKFQLPAPPVFKIMTQTGVITAYNGLYNGAPLKTIWENGDVRRVDPGPNQLFEWVNAQQLRVVGSNYCIDTNRGNQILLWSCAYMHPNQNLIPRPGYPNVIQWKNSNRCIISTDGDMTMDDCDTAIRRNGPVLFSYPYYPFESFNQY